MSADAPKRCSYFNTPTGCWKESTCPFAHVDNKFTVGCNKGAECPYGAKCCFLHPGESADTARLRYKAAFANAPSGRGGGAAARAPARGGGAAARAPARGGGAAARAPAHGGGGAAASARAPARGGGGAAARAPAHGGGGAAASARAPARGGGGAAAAAAAAAAAVGTDIVSVLFAAGIWKMGPLDPRSRVPANKLDDSWWEGMPEMITEAAKGSHQFELTERDRANKDVDMFGVLAIPAAFAIYSGDIDFFAKCFTALRNLIDREAEKKEENEKLVEWLSLALLFCSKHPTYSTSRQIGFWCLSRGAKILLRSFSSLVDWGRDLEGLVTLTDLIIQENKATEEVMSSFKENIQHVARCLGIRDGRADAAVWQHVLGFKTPFDVAPGEYIEERLRHAGIPLTFDSCSIAYPKGDVLARDLSQVNMVKVRGYWTMLPNGEWVRVDECSAYTQCVIGEGRPDAFTTTTGDVQIEPDTTFTEIASDIRTFLAQFNRDPLSDDETGYE